MYAEFRLSKQFSCYNCLFTCCTHGDRKIIVPTWVLCMVCNKENYRRLHKIKIYSIYLIYLYLNSLCILHIYYMIYNLYLFHKARTSRLPTSINKFLWGELITHEINMFRYTARMGTCTSNARSIRSLTFFDPILQPSNWGLRGPRKTECRKVGARAIKAKVEKDAEAESQRQKPICNILQPVGSVPYCKTYTRAVERSCFQWLQLRMAVWCQLSYATAWIPTRQRCRKLCVELMPCDLRSLELRYVCVYICNVM